MRREELLRPRNGIARTPILSSRPSKNVPKRPDVSDRHVHAKLPFFKPSLNHGISNSALNSKLLQTEQEKRVLRAVKAQKAAGSALCAEQPPAEGEGGGGALLPTLAVPLGHPFPAGGPERVGAALTPSEVKAKPDRNACVRLHGE